MDTIWPFCSILRGTGRQNDVLIQTKSNVERTKQNNYFSGNISGDGR